MSINGKYTAQWRVDLDFEGQLTYNFKWMGG